MGRKLDEDDVIRVMHQRIVGVSESRAKIIASYIPTAQLDVTGINKFIDGLVEIFADIRESNGDDSVCGLCEFDGAYIGESGDWCNECPGFNRDDCFKLRDEIRKKWIAEITACMSSPKPAPLTDKEKRIFLAAMGREEKICEEVDRNYVREPYEDTLVSICREITRKVKGTLWT